MAKEQFDKKRRLLNQNGQDGKKRPGFNLSRLIFYFIFILAGFYLLGGCQRTQETNWYDFKNTMLQENDVQKVVVVNEERAEVFLKEEALEKSKYQELQDVGFGQQPAAGPHYYFTIGSVETFENKMDQAMTDFDEEQVVPINYDSRFSFNEALPWVFPILLLVGMWYFLTKGMKGRGNKIFNMGKSKAKVYSTETRPNVKFSDVAGLEEAKVEIQEMVTFLKDTQKYTDLGAQIPKGVLLVGPPGTGKTLLGKAVAGEANVPFLSVSGSDFVEMFVGVGASRVRSLFEQAKKLAPCIVFVDEIDAIGRSRRQSKSMQSNDEQENTLNQLLQELDGFETNSGVIVIAATNRKDILDKALMRPGRFDREVFLELPNLNERKAILELHMKKVKISGDINTKILAAQTPGFSGADIANLCNEAAIIAARHDKTAVGMDEFMQAMDRAIAGLEKKSKIIPEDERKLIAYHEAGHAVVSRLLKNVENLVKVSIIPRGRSLGANWYQMKEHQINTRQELFDKMCAALAGRAAEEIVFNEISSGALNDLQRVTKMAYSMVAALGFNDKLGHVSFHMEQDQSFQKPYSEYFGRIIDEEVQKLIRDAYDFALDLIRENREKLNSIAELLLEKEVIFGKDLDQFFLNKPKEEVVDN